MYIEIDKLNKNFNDLKAIDNLSFTIDEGELLCILGPSGCGKTTILKTIGGFLKADSGRVKIDGVDITGFPPEERPVSTVFQSYALFPHMTVLENVIYGLKFRKYKKAEAISLGKKYLEMVGLEDEAEKKVTKLSGGQQQRVALARSLIINPKVLLLDEPLSNLDAKLRIKMREEIKNIQSKFNITMIFVTHDQEEALSIADKILIMNKGKLEQLDKPKEIYDHPKTDFVLDFLGYSNRVDNNIFIRPEKIVMDRTSGEQLGSIVDISFNGAYFLYKVHSNDFTYLVYRLNNEDDFKLGDEVYLSFKRQSLKD